MTSYGRYRERENNFHTPVNALKTKVYKGALSSKADYLSTYYDYSVPGYTSFESCRDTVSTSRPYTNHPLSIVKRSMRPPKHQGRIKLPYRSRYYDEYVDLNDFSGYAPMDSWEDVAGWFGSYETLPDLGDADMDALATSAYANINPNRASVDIPLFLFELRELPGMIKDLGDYLLKNSIKKKLSPRELAKQNLAFQFGWKPLLSDLQKLLKLHDSIQDRMRFFDKLNEGAQTVARNVRNDSSVEMSVFDGLHFAYFDKKYEYKDKVWYTAKLSADVPIDKPSRDMAAFRATTGFSQPTSTIWNAIPWTWLIDWFSNIGDVLSANSGLISFDVGQMCVMRMRSATATYSFAGIKPGYESIGYSVNAPRQRVVLKERRIYTAPPFIQLDLSLLNDKQKGILGSLVLARGSRVRKI